MPYKARRNSNTGLEIMGGQGIASFRRHDKMEGYINSINSLNAVCKCYV